MNQSSLSNYFFILGNHPTLSVAEILAYLTTKKYVFTVLAADYDYLIISTNQQLDANLLEFIGGSIKFGEIKKILDDFPTAEQIQDFLPNKEKVFFGLSLYPTKLKNKLVTNVFHLGLNLKKILKEKNKTARLVTSRQANLSAVVVVKNKLLSNDGVEMVIINQQKKYFLGRTLAVQPFENLSERDYGRPQRDDHSGMIPPKLAQIMLNLSLTNTDDLILDPFCGSGTILQEALWQQRKNLIGSDISNKAINDTQKNLTWLEQKYNLLLDNIKLVSASVLDLSKFIESESIDAIVTEPDLGRPDLNHASLVTEVARLEKLYVQSYQVFFKLLKKSGRVVMVWPVFFQDNFLDIEQQVEKIGFKKIRLLPTELLNIYKLNKRNNLQYARPGQKVGREITIWQKI